VTNNFIAWATPSIPEKLAINGPGIVERPAAEKFYFLGQTNATGQVEALMLLGSNAAHAATTLGSSATNGLYAGIIMRQCERAGAFFGDELHKLEWEGDNANAEIINRISDAIDLVGEPALAAACRELLSHSGYRLKAEKLLQAISAAKDDSTESYRAGILERFCQASDPQLRYSAVDALGNMSSHSSLAKELLKNIRTAETNIQIARLADLYIR